MDGEIIIKFIQRHLIAPFQENQKCMKKKKKLKIIPTTINKKYVFKIITTGRKHFILKAYFYCVKKKIYLIIVSHTS